MTITISLFWTVFIVFILHTIATHFFNWMWRKWNVEEFQIWLAAFLLNLIELILILSFIIWLT
jgi:hypothetical protein